MRNKNKDVAVMQRRLNHLECTTVEGYFVWRIQKVKQRRDEATTAEMKYSSLYSPTFFTSHAGYRLRMRVFLNGEPNTDAWGRQISLYVCLCKGQFDPVLPWPFRRNMRLLLLDQSGQRRHVSKAIRQDAVKNVFAVAFKRPETEMNVPIGFTQFAAFEEVYPENRPAGAASQAKYCDNDVLYLKCVVEPIDY